VINNVVDDEGGDFGVVEGAADHDGVAEEVVMTEFSFGEHAAPGEFRFGHFSVEKSGVDTVKGFGEIVGVSGGVVGLAAEEFELVADGAVSRGGGPGEDLLLVFSGVEDEIG